MSTITRINSSVRVHRLVALVAAGLMMMMMMIGSAQAFSGSKIVSPRLFLASPKGRDADKPKLVLIGGPPGTGKSTFGMSVALDQGILKCISTDTVRAVMRSFVLPSVSPALHRSSYASAYPEDDPVRSWHETCTVLAASVAGLVDDAIARGVSLVVEGVHVIPSNELIKKWEASGGVAIGCMLKIQDEQKHKSLLRRRGYITGNVENEETKIKSFDRIRAIQTEMMRLARESDWLQIEQRTEADPLDLIQSKLFDESSQILTMQDMLLAAEQQEQDLGALVAHKNKDVLS